MGDYTGLRYSAKLKKEAVPIVDLLYSDLARWDVVARAYPHPSFLKWATVRRRTFIPFGALCYMPDTWKAAGLPTGGKWDVCCSLKNYEGEIGVFLGEVLPLLIQEPCSCEVLFEAASSPEVWIVHPHPLKL